MVEFYEQLVSMIYTLFFSLAGGCRSVPSGCLRQGEIRRIKKRTGRTSLRRVSSHRPFPHPRKQDRHTVRSIRGRAPLPSRPLQLHHGKGQSEPSGFQRKTTGGFHVQHRQEDGLWRRLQMALSVHQVTKTPLQHMALLLLKIKSKLSINPVLYFVLRFLFFLHVL